MASGKEMEQDHLAESLNDLFTSVFDMVKGELQGTDDILTLLEKMNIRVTEEYTGFGDVASGLRVYVEQLKSKSGDLDEHIKQIDSFEAAVSMLDKYVSLLEKKMKSIYQIPTS